MTPPHKYHRTSVVEAGIDFVMASLWASASLWLVIYGNCVRDEMIVESVTSAHIASRVEYYCTELVTATSFGFAAMLFFLIGGIRGVIDMRLHQQDPDPIMFARGNWQK
jgi:hypothetical protein